MQIPNGLTAYDLVVLGLFALLIGRGIWLGLLKQVTGLAALYLGYLAAGQYSDRIMPVLRDISTNPKVVFLTSYVLLFIATYLVVMLVGKALSYVIQMSIAGWFDRLLGAAVGFAKGTLLVIIMHMILGTILAPESQMLKACATCDILNEASDVTRELISNEEARKAFLQQQPAIAIDAVKNYLTPESAANSTTSPPAQ